jgi:WD40 repeat protein/serine/threonine protein kinase
MDEDKIAIKITPTPTTQNMSDNNLQVLAKITRMEPVKIKERFSLGKSLTIVTVAHPKIANVVKVIKSIGFHVTTGAHHPKTISGASTKARSRTRSRTGPKSSDKDRSHPDEWKVGDVIENLYEVMDIKHGGMGAVYVARHQRWNTMLAIKSLHRKLRNNEEDRKLFIKEAETWIDIGFHPNIAACYYVRNIQDSPRIFIEYVGAGALNEWLPKKGKVGWDLVLDLMIQFSHGLEHAHAKGLVHRDVKPGNCMMTHDGTLKITDFGLTKRSEIVKINASEADLGTPDTVSLERESVTAAGMGTPGYMAPEMWVIGAEVGLTADIYAFGVMLFEICCGRKPFIPQGKGPENRKKLGIAHFKKPPPRPSDLRPEIPESIEYIILKCLAKDPADRYLSSRDLRQDLLASYEAICKKRFYREEPDEVKLLADAWNNRALSLMDLDHMEEAEDCLDKALQSDPNHPEAVYNRGLLEWRRTRNPDNRLVYKLEEVINAQEYRVRGAYLLGRCHLRLGDAENAVEACEISLEGKEVGMEVVKQYSIALDGAGKHDEAVDAMKTYLQEFPKDGDALGWLIGAMVRNENLEEAEETIQNLDDNATLKNLTPEEIAQSYIFTGLNEKLVIEGNTGWISCAAKFPKSPLIATGARDRSLKLWDAGTCELKNSFMIVGQAPSAIVISPDEKHIAICAPQKGAPVTIFSMETGKIAGSLMTQEGLVTCVRFSPDGLSVYTVEERGVVREWSLDQFRPKTKFKRIPAHLAADLIFQSSGKPLVYIGGMDKIVKRVDPSTSDIKEFERIHTEPITLLKVCGQGQRLVSVGRDRRAVSWDGESESVRTTLGVHQEAISLLALNPKRNQAATYDVKVGIKLWDDRNGEILRTYDQGTGELFTLSFDPEGEILMAGGQDLKLRAWDVRGRSFKPEMALAKIRSITKQLRSDKQFKATLEAAKKAMRKRQYSGAYALIRKAQNLPGYERSDLALDIIHRMKEHGSRKTLRGGWNKKRISSGASVMDLSYSPSAINFLSAHSDHRLTMWSAKTGEAVKTLQGHTNLVASVCFAPNGKEAASGSDDKTIRTWDLYSGRDVNIMKGHQDSVSAVAYSAKGDTLLSGSWDGTIRLWSSFDGSQIKVIKGLKDRVTSVDFVNRGEMALSAGFDGSVKMWDLSTGRRLRDLKAHKARVTHIKVSSDGALFASASTDGLALVWDLRRGATLLELEGHENAVRTVAFSRDGKFLASGGDDATVRIWDARTGAILRVFKGHTKEVSSVEFSFDGRFLISSSMDGVIMIWELDWEWEFEDLPESATSK